MGTDRRDCALKNMKTVASGKLVNRNPATHSIHKARDGRKLRGNVRIAFCVSISWEGTVMAWIGDEL